MLKDNIVCIIENQYTKNYPQSAFFSPSEHFPEYPFKDIDKRRRNLIYPMIRELFLSLGLDEKNYGTNRWNPLDKIIKKGDTVLIKPNLVRDFHGYGWDIQSVITHGSIIRPVIDYVYLALKGEGKIIIGDAPLQSADFSKLTELSGVDRIVNFYRKIGVDIEVIDFRCERALLDKRGLVLRKERLPGDPSGYTVVNLGKDSLLEAITKDYKRYRVTDYNPKEMRFHHNKETNEYLIPNSAIEADVIINLPKLKTHRYAGITASLKNIIGLNGQKDWLPHYKVDSKEEGGDEYLHRNLLRKLSARIGEKEDAEDSIMVRKVLRNIRRIINKIVRMTVNDPYWGGLWYGNDTIWRTILDLNRIIFYAGKDGKMHNKIQRKHLCIVDGIIAGEGEGPLEPTPKPCGILIGGFNPVAIDAVIAKLIGFDHRKIPTVSKGFSLVKYPLCKFSSNQIKIILNCERWININSLTSEENLNFKPSKGWEEVVDNRYNAR